jgi:predicted small secreted protein
MKSLLITLLVVALLLIQGCGTVQGFGHDLEWLGQKLETTEAS